ncbi:hypothetical protein KUTeg_014326 [Tegillarca granosa]|uniref:Cystatin domain-containing protein n=1 Tax=Tegillarca granosa TaxID=220873 RepID=A0ABQ9EZR1_TEGGR|nr:hypothetical protein KUTeg_014326 [Tegillarca granosa]
MTDQEIQYNNEITKMIALIVLGVLSTTNAQLMGGWSPLTNQTTIDIMSSFAMSALTAESRGNKDYSGCKVTHSEKQVVAGMNYRFTMHCGEEMCTVTVYDVPWMNSRTLSSRSCRQHQARLGGILAGGVSAGCPDAKTIEAAMPTILQGIDMRSNSMLKVMPVSQTVTDCTRQVVAGMKYTFTVTVHYSSCMKSDAGSTLSDCPITDTSLPDEKMKVSIVSQPWMHPQFTLLSVDPIVIVQKNHKKHGHKETGHDKKLKFHGKGHKLILNGDNHDLIHHGQRHKNHQHHLFGGDMHDMVYHGKKPLLGGDGHDMVHHGKNLLLGGDGHDMAHHGKKPLLGGDGHDMAHHGKKPLLGRDGHDMAHHGKKPLLGGDGHDMAHHGKKPLLGGDGHDMAHHGKKPLLGGDGHDMAHHGKNPLLGGDGHDMKKHGQGKKNQNLKLYGEFKAFQKKYNKNISPEKNKSTDSRCFRKT